MNLSDKVILYGIFRHGVSIKNSLAMCCRIGIADEIPAAVVSARCTHSVNKELIVKVDGLSCVSGSIVPFALLVKHFIKAFEQQLVGIILEILGYSLPDRSITIPALLIIAHGCADPAVRTGIMIRHLFADG